MNTYVLAKIGTDTTRKRDRCCNQKKCLKALQPALPSAAQAPLRNHRRRESCCHGPPRLLVKWEGYISTDKRKHRKRHERTMDSDIRRNCRIQRWLLLCRIEPNLYVFHWRALVRLFFWPRPFLRQVCRAFGRSRTKPPYPSALGFEWPLGKKTTGSDQRASCWRRIALEPA